MEETAADEGVEVAPRSLAASALSSLRRSTMSSTARQQPPYVLVGVVRRQPDPDRAARPRDRGAGTPRRHRSCRPARLTPRAASCRCHLGRRAARQVEQQRRGSARRVGAVEDRTALRADPTEAWRPAAPGARSSRADRAIEPLDRRVTRALDQPGEIVDRRGRTGQHARTAGCPSSKRSGTVVGRRQQLVRPQLSRAVAGVGDQHPVVRTEELVRRADEEVGPERGQVDQCVRRLSAPRPPRAARRPRVSDRRIVATSGRVPIRLLAAVTATSRVRSLISEPDRLDRQLSARRIEVRPPNPGARPLGGDHPRPDVGVVVEPGDHDLVPRRARSAQSSGPGSSSARSRCGRRRRRAGRRRAGRRRRAGLGDDLARALRAAGVSSTRGSPAGRAKSGRDRVDHRVRRLGAAGRVEVRVAAGERREVRSDPLDVELSATGSAHRAVSVARDSRTTVTRI